MSKTTEASSRSLPIKIDYSVYDKRWKVMLPELKRIGKVAVGIALNEVGYFKRSKRCCFSVRMTNNEEIRALNHSFRGKDKPTDVLSFPADDAAFGDLQDQIAVPTAEGGMDKYTAHNSKVKGMEECDVFSIDKPNLEVGERYIGDIVINHDAIEEAVKERDTNFFNHYTHLIVHSVLHLLGYDHVKARDAERMEGLEVQILKRLGIPNPYQQD